MMDYAATEPIIAWLLTYAVHSTLLIALAWLVAGGNSKLSLVVRDTIWKAALVGGIATASLQHIAGFRPWTGASESPAPAILGAAVLPEIDFAPANTVEPTVPPIASGLKLDETTPTLESTSAAVAATRIPVDWRRVFVALWIVGMVLGLIRLAFARLNLRRILSARSNVTELQLLSALTEMRHRARIYRPLHLTQSDRLPAAVALRNEICMPVRVFSELSFAHRKAMLAHEVAHIARRDNIWLTVSLLLERIFFFQPLNRIARKQLQEVAEFLCDDWAVTNTGHHLTFAECLAEAAGWVLNGNAGPIVAPSFADQRSQLVRRVERVLSPGSARDWGRGRLRPIMATIGLLVFGFSAPGFATVDVEPAPADAFDVQITPPVFSTDSTVASVPVMEPIEAGNDEEAAPVEVSSTVAVTPGAKSVATSVPEREDTEPVQDTVDARIVRSLITALSDQDAGVRREAVQALGELRATDAVPALIGVLQDESTSLRRSAASALQRMRDVRALPGLTNAMTDDSASVRVDAIEAIVSIVRSVDEGARDVHRSAVSPGIVARLGDPDARVQRQAISAVASLRLTAGVNALPNLTRDESASVRRSALLALAAMGDSTHVPVFVNALTDSVPEIRAAALRGISKHPNTVSISSLTPALRDANPEVRRSAASIIGQVGGAGAVDALLPLIRDEHPEVRATAIRALGRVGDRRAVAAIATALNDSSADVREMVVRILGELGDSTSFTPLRSALADTSADVRVYAIRSLARVGGARAAAPIRPMLNDANSEVREYAARVLGSLKDEASVDALIGALSDSDADVRQHAVRALTEIKSPAAINGMVTALADDNSDVRQQAVRGLSAFNDPRVVEPLIAALRDGSSDVRGQAANALGRLRDPRSRDALIAATEDPDAGVRRAAVRALGRIR